MKKDKDITEIVITLGDAFQRAVQNACLLLSNDPYWRGYREGLEEKYKLGSGEND